METITFDMINGQLQLHGSYLQGMETEDCIDEDKFKRESTDPTYKEWKQETRKLMKMLQHAARILPTRNGNLCMKMCRKQKKICTDPTYKEWKPLYEDVQKAKEDLHGSYLQGMETYL